jgi:hypothetical protein
VTAHGAIALRGAGRYDEAPALLRATLAAGELDGPGAITRAVVAHQMEHEPPPRETTP